MAVSKVQSSNFNKSSFTVQTGAGNYNLPRQDTDALYGPGWPIQPVTRPEDSELPRTLDYPVGINYTLQPRVGYQGLFPVAALKAAYTNVSEVSAPVNLIIRELGGFMAQLRDPKTKQRVKTGHPYEWMAASPDRTVPFNVWLARFKKSAKVYAAPCFYMKREGNDVTAMEYIDGSTFFLIVNSRGNLPEPDEVDEDVKKFLDRIRYGLNSGDPRATMSMPELAQTFLSKQRARLEHGKTLVTTTPAYTQIIKGVPFSFWDKSQVYFVPEPPAPAVDSPYGETYIERSWTWINIIAVLTAFHLAHYRTGNTPEGLMMLPKDMFPSMAKLASGEREWNARMAESSQVQHARNRWMPEGTQYIPTKSPEFPADLYKQSKNNILAAIGVPASEAGDKPQQGLGGKGFEQGAAHDVTRQILEIEKENLEDAFNYVLRKQGVNDAEFYMDYPQEEIDPSKQQEDLWNKFSHGVFTLNDVLTAQGKNPIGDPADPENIANLHIIVAGTTMFVVEKIKPDENGIISPSGGQQPEFGGSPQNPEDAMAGNKKGVPPDKKTMKKIMETIEATGGKVVGTTTYSIPYIGKVPLQEAGDVHLYTGDPNNIQKASVCPDWADPEQFAVGVREEQEHADTLDNDQATIAGIVLDHLRENPKYYGEMHKGNSDSPIAAGLVVRAKDTGRVLMLQRSDTGQWEFPGGNLEDNESSLLTAQREWCEETGLPLPEGEASTQWTTPDGVYCGHIFLIPAEEGLDIHGERAAIIPDDPDGDKTESIAWWDPAQLWNNPAMRRELSLSMTQVEDALSHSLPLAKHCGVCPEDSEYFGAPIMRDRMLTLGLLQPHANGVEIVSMQPKGLPAQLALWKPAGQEKDSLNASIGGRQYPREEAAWLIDQSLGFELVPLAYVTTSPEGEEGAAIWYTAGNTQCKDANKYAPAWIEKAGVLDYILSHLDRNGKNYLTHPDDPTRMVLVDNGYSLPEKELHAHSDFVNLMQGVQLSEQALNAIRALRSDLSMWQDVEDLIGPTAVIRAQACAQELLEAGMIKPEGAE